MQELIDPFDPSTPATEVAAAAAGIMGLFDAHLVDELEVRLVVGRVLNWWTVYAPDLHPTTRRALAEETERLLRQDSERLSNEYARTLATLADCDLATGEEERAEARSREAWTRLATVFGEGHWVPALARARLARALEAQGLSAEAAPHAAASAAVLEAQMAVPLDRTVSAMFWLPELDALRR